MGRPFALLGFSTLGALVLAAYLGPAAAGVLAWVCGGLGLCALLTGAVWAAVQKRASRAPAVRGFRLRRKGPRRIVIGTAALLAASLSLFLFSSAWKAQVEPYQKLDGVEARVRGQILDYPEQSYHRSAYLLRVERVTAGEERMELEPFTVRLTTDAPFLCGPGDFWEGTVTFYAFSEGGLYSSRNSRLADGTVLGAYLTGYENFAVVPQAERSPGRLFAELRHTLKRGFDKRLPGEEAALIQAMLLGERDALPEAAYSDFQKIGSTHLLVISGLHMAALAAFLTLLCRRLPLGRVGRNLLTAGVLVCFLALTAFPVSALRGGIMYLLFLLADCFGRKADGVNSLGVAVLVICLQNPFAGMDLGFALSVLATLGILTLYPALYRAFLAPLQNRPRFLRAAKPAAASFAVTLSALLFTLPVQASVFQGLPLLAPLANLLLVLPCTLLLYCAFAAAFLLLLPPLAPLAAPFVFCAGWLSRAVLWAARELARIPGAYLDLGQSTWLLVLGMVLILAFVAARPGRPGKSRAVTGMAVCLSAGLLLLGGMFEAWRWRDVVTVAVGDPAGSSCVAVLKNREASLLTVDGYNTGAAKNLLARNNVMKLNSVYLPVRSPEAREAVGALTQAYRPEHLFLPESAYAGKDLSREKTGAEPAFVKNGQGFEALPGVEVSVSSNGGRLSFQANGTPVAVEWGPSGAGTCALLVTSQRDSRVNSAFTVLQADAIIEENPAPDSGAEVRPGYILLPAEQGAVYLDILRDGAVQIRRGNGCPPLGKAN